jgi:hypothetical protein
MGMTSSPPFGFSFLALPPPSFTTSLPPTFSFMSMGDEGEREGRRERERERQVPSIGICWKKGRESSRPKQTAALALVVDQETGENLSLRVVVSTLSPSTPLRPAVENE